MGECFTTFWQPKVYRHYSSSSWSSSTSSYIHQVFDVLAANARAAGRHFVHVLDLDTGLRLILLFINNDGWRLTEAFGVWGWTMITMGLDTFFGWDSTEEFDV